MTNTISNSNLLLGCNLPTKPIIEVLEKQLTKMLKDGKKIDDWLLSLNSPIDPSNQNPDPGQILSNIYRTKNYLLWRDTTVMKGFAIKVLRQMGGICGKTKSCIESFFDKSIEVINHERKELFPDVLDWKKYCIKNVGDEIDCKLKNDVGYRGRYAAYKLLGPALQYSYTAGEQPAYVDINEVQEACPIAAEMILGDIDGKINMNLFEQVVKKMKSIKSESIRYESLSNLSIKILAAASIVGLGYGIYKIYKRYTTNKKPI